MREKPTKLKLYLLRYRGNVPGEIVSTRLAGRFYAYRSRFLVGPLAQCLGAFGFYSNVTKHAGFRSESCGIGSLSEVLEVPTMMTTIVTARAAMPGFGVDIPPYILSGISSVFQSNEKRSCANAVSASKQASKPLLNKGLLLSDRNDFGRLSSHFCVSMTTGSRRYGNDTSFFAAKSKFWIVAALFCPKTETKQMQCNRTGGINNG